MQLKGTLYCSNGIYIQFTKVKLQGLFFIFYSFGTVNKTSLPSSLSQIKIKLYLPSTRDFDFFSNARRFSKYGLILQF